MSAQNRTKATCFYTLAEVLVELDALKFAVTSIAEQLQHGSYGREMAMNASRGIDARIDYLHDCIRINAAQKERP